MAITTFMPAQGYEPDKLFNALHGATRLNFHAPCATARSTSSWAASTWPTRSTCDRLGGCETLALADLLLTKPQVVDVYRKDLVDIAALLLDHALAQDDIDELGLDGKAAGVVCRRTDELLAALDAAPKTLRWKARARFGERVRWYQQPEEVRR